MRTIIREHLRRDAEDECIQPGCSNWPAHLEGRDRRAYGLGRAGRIEAGLDEGEDRGDRACHVPKDTGRTARDDGAAAAVGNAGANATATGAGADAGTTTGAAPARSARSARDGPPRTDGRPADDRERGRHGE